MTATDSDPQVEPISRSAKVLGLVVGLVLSVLISSALVIATAKAGISPGVSPLVVLFGWVAFGAFLGPRLKGFLAMVQVTGSGGAAVSAGVIFTAPIMQIYFGGERGVDVLEVLLATLSGALLGWGFVGLSTRQYLLDPRLPAPEAVACDRLINTAANNPTDRPPVIRSLFMGCLIGAVFKALLHFQWLAEEVFRIRLPGFARTTEAVEGAASGVTLGLPMQPLYLGIGALLTLPTAILIFSGGLINAVTVDYAAAEGITTQPYRWVGGAAMTVAVVFSLGRYLRDGYLKKKELERDTGSGSTHPILEIPGPVRNMLIGSIVVGFVLLITLIAITSKSVLAVIVIGVVGFIVVALLSGLGGLLSLQIGSSASPVSGTVFVAMLVLSSCALLCLEGDAAIAALVPVLVAVCVAICAANDSSQDYKTMQLNHFRVADSFRGQLVGLLGGAIAVPFALSLAHEQLGGLGSASLPCPQATFFAGVLELLFSKSDLFHESMIKPLWQPIGVGLVLGVVAIVVETLGRRRGLTLSSLAFAVGIYLPSAIAVGILIGALARWVGSRRGRGAGHQGILAAAGLISGYALFSLTLGILLAADFGKPIDARFSDRFGETLYSVETWDELDEKFDDFQQFRTSVEGVAIMDSDAGQAFYAADGETDFAEARRALTAAPIWKLQQANRFASREWIGQLLLAAMVIFVILNFMSRFRPKSERDETDS